MTNKLQMLCGGSITQSNMFAKDKFNDGVMWLAVSRFDHVAGYDNEAVQIHFHGTWFMDPEMTRIEQYARWRNIDCQYYE
jgi:hypothetical protein